MGVKDILKDNKKFLLLVVLLIVVCIFTVVAMNSGLYRQAGLISKDTYSRADNVIEAGIDYNVVVKTVYGDITIDLYEELAPQGSNSILFLAGKRYYDDLTFHKVIRSFVVQAGDVAGTGLGNPGYDIPLENRSAEFSAYSVGMANASQFFIVLPKADMKEFNGKYTLVGEVIRGFDVVDSIAKVEVDDNDKPINDVTINYIQIIEN